MLGRHSEPRDRPRRKGFQSPSRTRKTAAVQSCLRDDTVACAMAVAEREEANARSMACSRTLVFGVDVRTAHFILACHDELAVLLCAGANAADAVLIQVSVSVVAG